MTLPIMLFDDRKLKPAFGYVFDPTCLEPYESIVSILWKYARQNRLPGHLITVQLTRKPIDPYEGIAACERQVDIREVHNALGLRLKTVRESMLPEALHRSSSPWLRYCRKCLNTGYHSVVHQLNRVEKCPIHDIALLSSCRNCGGCTPYWLNALLLDAPYRCSKCREIYSGVLPSLPKRPPMQKWGRTAITRARFG